MSIAAGPQAVVPNFSPGPEYADDQRRFQGIPGLERSPNGRLWAVWYAGGDDEGSQNYVIVVTSGDDGKTWSGPKLVVDPPGTVRAFDPTLWLDPAGRLWLFWAQSYANPDHWCGVWAMTTREADREDASWTDPRWICDGIMMNKPTVLSTGEWLLPASVWREHGPKPIPEKLAGANVVISRDQGETFATLGRAQVDDPLFDEHSIIERRDGSLWMWIRVVSGIATSVSTDRGVTWSHGEPSPLKHTSSRFFIRRLHSGRLLLVKHSPPDRPRRSHLTAYLSDDDGATWRGGLLLDERDGVSYPDGFQSPEGTIYVVYDFARYGDKKILMATFTEEDVLAGAFASPAARSRVLINQATGVNRRGK
jgi:hypothetical protein